VRSSATTYIRSVDTFTEPVKKADPKPFTAPDLPILLDYKNDARNPDKDLSDAESLVTDSDIDEHIN
jgi:hypothetical protein